MADSEGPGAHWLRQGYGARAPNAPRCVRQRMWLCGSCPRPGRLLYWEVQLQLPEVPSLTAPNWPPSRITATYIPLARSDFQPLGHRHITSFATSL